MRLDGLYKPFVIDGLFAYLIKAYFEMLVL